MNVTIRANCWDGIHRKSIGRPTLTAVNRPPMPIDARRLLDPRVKALLSYAVPVMFAVTGLPPFAMAQTPDAIPAMDVVNDALKQKILHAFDPIIDLATLLAYPVAGVMIAGGCLFIMCGSREAGMKMLQNAAIGYILVQLSPVFLNILVGIGSAV